MFKSIRVGRQRQSGPYVLGIFAGTKRLPAHTAKLRENSVAELRGGLKRPGFSGAAGDLAILGTGTALIGLGPAEELTLDRLRVIAAGLVRRLDASSLTSVQLDLAHAISKAGLDARQAGQAIGEGMGLANWRVDMFDGTVSDRPAPHGALGVALRGDPALGRGMRDGLVLAESANEARRLGATPPNQCTPAWMAKESRALARSTGMSCRVIDARQIAQQGMGGLEGVGRGSRNPPCLIVLEHKPPRARKGVKLVLVGKTITFDTGGYSLKPPAGMKGMKYDKCGGCAVFGAMRAIAKLKLPVHVVALLPAAENMVSDDAYRPDDIITMYNGATVEVTNTDAEGRLVLADALAYATKRLSPTTIIDAATLTGGVVVALGSWCAGLFCNDDELRAALEEAAVATGEYVWQLPLWDEHRKFMRSRHADLWNSGPKRDGHPIQGAAFLSYFVGEDIPWAHLDIAGMASTESEDELHVAGPTGYGVRLLTEYVRSVAG